MRRFLKKLDVLSVSLIVALWSYGAIATTITRPYGSSDYLGGRPAVGPKVNAEFDNIVNWLNGGNIASSNIASLGVKTANLDDLSVTTAKLATGSVTKLKLATEVLAISSSSSAYSTSSVSPSLVTNLSTTLTTNGRPVRVRLEGAPTQYLVSGALKYGSFVDDAHLSAGSATDSLFIINDSGTVYNHELSGLSTSALVKTYPCSAFSYTEYPSAGSHSWIVYAAVSNAANSVAIYNCRLVVEEL